MAYTVSQFKEVLDGLGFNLGPDGLNGNHGNALDAFTQAAIQELQAYYQLPITGKLDTVTDTFVRKVVCTLQHQLNLVDNARLPVNEFYGPRTVQAIKFFQRMHGLPVTGIASAIVRQKLSEAAQKHAIAPREIADLALSASE